MSDRNEISSGGVGQIRFTGNMACFEFVTILPAEGRKSPVPQSNLQITMPPQGSSRVFNLMRHLFNNSVQYRRIAEKRIERRDTAELSINLFRNDVFGKNDESNATAGQFIACCSDVSSNLIYHGGTIFFPLG